MSEFLSFARIIYLSLRCSFRKTATFEAQFSLPCNNAEHIQDGYNFPRDFKVMCSEVNFDNSLSLSQATEHLMVPVNTQSIPAHNISPRWQSLHSDRLLPCRVGRLSYLSNFESYAGESVNFWQGHPTRTGQGVEVQLSAVYWFSRLGV